MTTYLGSTNLLTPKQSGFRKGHSCITALLKVTEDLRQDLDKDKISFLVLLDFSKAFDMVDHLLLCDKLFRQFNFSFCAVKLLRSYLTDRMQAVQLNNNLSDFLPISRGVPEGSILGPLFSLVKYSSIHMYADDVQIYLSCPLGLIEHGVSCLNEDLEKSYVGHRKMVSY